MGSSYSRALLLLMFLWACGERKWARVLAISDLSKTDMCSRTLKNYFCTTQSCFMNSFISGLSVSWKYYAMRVLNKQLLVNSNVPFFHISSAQHALKWCVVESRGFVVYICSILLEVTLKVKYLPQTIITWGWVNFHVMLVVMHLIASMLLMSICSQACALSSAGDHLKWWCPR